VYSDGYPQKWVELISRDASVAVEHLSLAARMDRQCRPLVAVWFTIKVTSEHDGLTSGENLQSVVSRPVDAYPSSWVDVVFNAARRSDTWTAHH
jgi:hypothetical protein